MNWDKWMIDASMSDNRRGRCLCPVELDKHGNVENIVLGMNYIGDKPPHGEIIGIFHPDGQDAVEQWIKDNPELASV